MDQSALRDRVWASIPSDDPRFADLRAELARVAGRGRGSPIPRMAGEWMLLGYLLTHGQIAVGGAPPAAPADDPNQDAAQRHIDTALAGMDFE